MYPPSQSQLHSFMVSGLSLVSCWSNVTPLMNWRERPGWHVQQSCQAPGLRRELSLNWKAALVPSQTFVGLHKVQMYGVFQTGQKARGTQPLTAFSKRRGNSQNRDSCVFSLALPIWKDTGSWKVASLRLLIATPCACREVSLSFFLV